MRKYTNKQQQLCKILSSLTSPQAQNKLPSIQFDDKLVSQSPQTQLAHRRRPSLLRKSPERQELEKRKERIKEKIKSQIKAKIEQRCSQLDQLRVEDSPQINQRSSNLMTKTNSQIIWRRRFQPKGRKGILLLQQGNSINPQSRKSLQMQDFVQRKSLVIRTRSLKSNHDSRRCQESQMGKVGLRQRKEMVRCDQDLPNRHCQQLNPWRYAQQHDVEYLVLIRKSYAS